MKNSLIAFTCLFFVSMGALIPTLGQSQVQTEEYDETNPLQITATLSRTEWPAGISGELKLDLRLPKGYRAYEDQFKFLIYEPDGFKAGPIQISPIAQWYDKFLKKNKSGILEQATAKIQIEAPPSYNRNFKNLKFELTYQACSDQFCLFPTTKTVTVPIKLIGAPAESNTFLEPSKENGSKSSPPFLSSENFSEWMNQGLLPSLIFVFIAGILTSFTPCIFPMIPITLAVLGNHAEKRTRVQNFTFSLIYVLGIATTYSIFGVIAALSGGLFGASLGNPIVLGFICILLLLMSLSMYGLFEIQVPAAIRNRFGAAKTKANPTGAYLTGLFAGVIASPCVGPVLVAILTYVSVTKNAFLGFLLLFVYALGLGLIFLVLGAYSELAKKLPRSGPWMDLFKFSLGTLMLGAFYYYLNLLVPSRLFDAALGLGLVILASTFGAFQRPQNIIKSIKKGLLQACLFVGFVYLSIGIFDLRPIIQSQMMGTASINKTSKIQWQEFTQEKFESALASGKPVLIDFWADWCAACHEMDQKTFTDPVIESLSVNYVFLKYDATKDSENLKALKAKYGIQGLPTILFFDRSGQWVSRLTLTQFEDPRAFANRLQELLK